MQQPILIDFARTAPEFAAVKDPPQDWLIDGLLPHPSVGMIYGWRGTGKTMVAVSLGIAVAEGGVWLREGLTARNPRGVLLIDGELAPRGLRGRLRLFGRKPEGLILIALEEFVARGGRKPNLKDAEGRDAITRLIMDVQSHYQIEIELVILDSWVFLARGVPENDNTAPIEILDWMVGLRTAGVSVLFMHHAGKPDDEGKRTQRGASAREDPLDYVVALKPLGSRDGPAHFRFELDKSRELVDFEPFEVKLERGQWTTPAGSVRKGRIIEVLKGLGRASFRQLRAETKINGSKLSELLEELETEGRVKQHGTGWVLAESGVLDPGPRTPTPR